MNTNYLFFPGLLALALLGHNPATAQTAPEWPSPEEWFGIRQQHEQPPLPPFAVDHAYEAYNPGQRWSTRFDGRGFSTRPETGAGNGDSNCAATVGLGTSTN
jgi:hypothetical protein